MDTPYPWFPLALWWLFGAGAGSLAHSQGNRLREVEHLPAATQRALCYVCAPLRASHRPGAPGPSPASWAQGTLAGSAACSGPAGRPRGPTAVRAAAAEVPAAVPLLAHSAPHAPHLPAPAASSWAAICQAPPRLRRVWMWHRTPRRAARSLCEQPRGLSPDSLRPSPPGSPQEPITRGRGRCKGMFLAGCSAPWAAGNSVVRTSGLGGSWVWFPAPAVRGLMRGGGVSGDGRGAAVPPELDSGCLAPSHPPSPALRWWPGQRHGADSLILI